jgi:2'-5' RNA ligase
MSDPGGAQPVDEDRIRSFVSTSVPAAVAATIDAALAPWREAFPSARWVPVEDWHVTIAFLGSAPPAQLSWAIDRLGGVAAGTAPFETRVRGCGAFPSARRATVLWVGLEDPADAFGALARRVSVALADRFSLEDRVFRPHLTIARCTKPLSLPDGYESGGPQSSPFTIEAFELTRSRLGRSSPRYEPIVRFQLAGTR